ncbi:phage major capsid protein, P2 family [Paracidovorax avenae]|uniref:phage major capsid protein, P2 family n=1 Tax=Paracidovorax avenae TaxID=80867 RepID=UPI000D204E8E|nr:phage major capsid protein, P2 family [Paracidovorax avenae]AVS66654.1 phage major capsid protein, P2 family [Paracidovorax avenae]
MRNETRMHYERYVRHQAILNDVSDATKYFNVAPSVQQTLENKLQESSEFLKSINVVGVDELKGEKLGLGLAGPIASRTDTSGDKRRKTRDIATMDGRGYECFKTNYDTHIRYGTLDAWAKFKDFQTRITNLTIERCALDRMMIGFNGLQAAADTDLTKFPLLQDVNIGWLEKLRQEAPAQVMKEVVPNSKKIRIGAGGDYANLDALVYDISKTLIAPAYQEDPKLVALTGRDLMHDKLFPLVSDQKAPTEILAADIVRSQRRLGNLPGLAVPYFPPKAVLVTRLDNLSIYFQTGGRRRAVIERPERDCIEHYNSSNDAFVIERLELAALAENIEMV